MAEIKPSQNMSQTSEKTSEVKTVTFKIVDENNYCMRFKMHTTEPLRKAINAFVAKTNKDLPACRFMYDGVRIDPRSAAQTPESMGIEENGVIDVYAYADGGF